MSRSVYECPKSGSVVSTVCRIGASAVFAVLLAGLAGCSAELSRFNFSDAKLNGESSKQAAAPIPRETVHRNAGLGGPAEPAYVPPMPRGAAVDMAPLADPVPAYPTPVYSQPAYNERPTRSAGLSPQPMVPPADARAAAYVADPSPHASASAHRMGAAPASLTIEVESGDTLSSIAKQYRVSISELMSMNGLHSPSVRPGQKLIVPGGKRAVALRDAATSHPAAYTPSIPAPTPSPTPALAPAPRSIAADTLAGPQVAPLMPEAPRPAIPAASPSNAPATLALGADWTGTHTLAPGESLYAIARRHGVKLADLQTVNGVTDPNKLRPGTVLKVPANAAVAAAPAAPVSVSPSNESLRPKILNEAARPAADGQKVAALGGGLQPLTDGSPGATKAEQVAAPPPALDAPPKLGGTGKFRWPVKGKIVAAFGPRGDGHNDGINIAVPLGTDVAAAEAGVVAYAGNELKGYGNLVLVRHDNNWVSAYAHNDQILVKRGDKVKRGQILAKAGNSGTVDQPQVHFELRQGSKPIDPLPHMEKN